MAKAPRAFTLLLRVLALAATISATVVMATSHQTTTFFNVSMEAKFQYTPAFKFFLIANAIGAVYCMLTLFIPPTSSLSRLVVVFDVLITMLLVASISAAGAISQVGKKGNRHTGWLPICGQVHKFCDQVMGALICGFVGVVACMVLLVHTIRTLTYSL